MSRVIDLSCDLGEARTEEEREIERAIWPLISAANVACGGHVGDRTSMREAVERCIEHDITLGAHPSYPDREGFGRRHMEISSEDLVASLAAQLDELRDVAATLGRSVMLVKPHGTLYNEAQKDERLANVVASAVERCLPDAAVVCAAGSEMERIALRKGLVVVREAFVDRRYAKDGSLQPRGEEGSLLLDPDAAVAQAIMLAESGHVVAADGSRIRVTFDTLCAHSDMDGSVERIRRVRAALLESGFDLSRS